MENGIFFSIVSLVYSLLLVIVFFSKERFVSQENNIYRKIIVVNLIGLLIEIFLSTYASRYLMAVNQGLALIILRFRLVYFIAWVSLFSFYIVSLCVGERKLDRDSRMKITNKALVVLAIMFIIGTICVFVLPLLFYRRGNMTYTYGLATTSVYVVCGIEIISWIILMIMNIKYIVNKKYIPILLFILIGVVVTVLQAKNPELTLMVPLQTFITFLMYFTIENPDMKMIEELEEEKLKASNASIAKTEFLSSMSHEIRNPLNVIIGLAEDISSEEDNNISNKNAKDIIETTKALLSTVDGILDITKIEKGNKEIVNTIYDVRETFEEIGRVSAYKFMNKNVDFTYKIAKDLPNDLLGDYLTLKRIISCLVNESVRTTKVGSSSLTVNCINTNDICKLIISLEDTGIGIKSETLEAIFGNGENTSKAILKETSLNLINAKKLVDLMGGKIVAQSVYNEGSKYTVIINQRIKEKVDNTNNITIDLSDKNILLVDDNPLNLKVTAKKLAKYNPKSIIRVESGYECLGLIEQGDIYDLIFMDDMMPNLTGTETLHKLKEKENFKTPVIALTANAIVGMKEKYLKSGFDDYLAKPLDRDDLEVVLDKILNNREVVEKDTVESNEIIPVEGDITDALTLSNNNSDEIDSKDNKVINVDKALEFMDNLDEFYSSLEDFSKKTESYIDNISKYARGEDLDKYFMTVQALKTDCNYLGITRLADIAYEHELRSKEKDKQFVLENYQYLVKKIKEIKPDIDEEIKNHKEKSS